MIRTQIYLSEEQKRQLAALALSKGENVSEIVREAVDSYLVEKQKTKRTRKEEVERVLQSLSGVWQDNDTDFEANRRSADRRLD